MFCKYCGRKMGERDMVCPHCGREREAMQFSTGLEELLGGQNTEEASYSRQGQEHDRELDDLIPENDKAGGQQKPVKVSEPPQRSEKPRQRGGIVRNALIFAFVLLVVIAAVVRYALPSRKSSQDDPNQTVAGGTETSSETEAGEPAQAAVEVIETSAVTETAASDGETAGTTETVPQGEEKSETGETDETGTLSGLPGDTSAQMLFDRIKEQDETIAQLQSEIEEQDKTIAQLQTGIEDSSLFREYLFSYFGDENFSMDEYEYWKMTVSETESQINSEADMEDETSQAALETGASKTETSETETPETETPETAQNKGGDSVNLGVDSSLR